MKKYVLAVLGTLLSNSSAIGRHGWMGEGSFGSSSSFIRNNLIVEDLELPDYPENIGLSKHIKSKTPLRTEVPEIEQSKFWNYLYYYDNMSYWLDRGKSTRPYAAGYTLDLITSRNCNTDPFKGSCYGGRFAARVNANDKKFITNLSRIQHEPIPNTKRVSLAYGLSGYLDGSSITWLDGGGKYTNSIGERTLELVLLANAANMDLKSKTGPNTRQTLLGKVGNAPTNMLLRRSGSWLWGTYFYDRGKAPAITDRLYVVGEIKNGRFQLREYDLSGYPDKLPPGNAVPTSAVWNGILNDQGVLRGTVTNSKTKKAFPVSLQPQR